MTTEVGVGVANRHFWVLPTSSQATITVSTNLFLKYVFNVFGRGHGIREPRLLHSTQCSPVCVACSPMCSVLTSVCYPLCQCASVWCLDVSV